MKSDVFDINDFIKLNKCPEVTNPIFFSSNKIETSDGLFSRELFGHTEEERANIFGYIDLKGHYINPFVYSMLSSRMGSMKGLISGDRYAIVNKAKKIEFVNEDTPGAQTGLKFIYDNFEYIDWINEVDEAEISSLDKKTRLKCLKLLKKNEFFVNKWLVLPPYYREKSSENESLGDIVNDLYKTLINSTRNMNSGFTFEIFADQTRKKIQETLNYLYLVTTGPISGKSLDPNTMEMKGNAKNSLIKKNLIGKNLDFGALNVFVAPQVSDAPNPKETPVPFGYTGIPLITLVGIFKPFFLNSVHSYLNHFMEDFISNNAKLIKSIDRNQFATAKVDKLLIRYIKSSSERFDPVSLKFTGQDGSEYEYNMGMIEYNSRGDAENKKNGTERVVTYTDLMYQASMDSLKNKHALVTRYPIFDTRNIYPSKVLPLSTARTRKIWVYPMNAAEFVSEPIVYDRYPYTPFFVTEGGSLKELKTKPDAYYEFINCTILGNAVLQAIGGDYDGDTCFIRGLFSNEANQEAAELIKKKSNILTVDGKLLRSLGGIGKENLVALYELTKD